MLRLRIPELLAKRGLAPYAVSKRSGGRISMSTAYRPGENGGRLEAFSAGLIEGLLNVFDVGIAELMEQVPDCRPRAR